MNAFERLIDRSLFAGLGLADSPPPPEGQEASNSWTLLQALLRQNEQARSYTQRLLLKKAREQPGIRPRSMERLRALVELWPVPERAALLAAFGEAEQMSPSKPPDALAAGTSTPPRRTSHTPDWGGPTFSESPALPGSRRQVGGDRYGLEDSAVTVQIRNSREVVGDSAATLGAKRQGTSNSLDAWLGPNEDVAAQMRRTRSLPASALGVTKTRSWAPQLVLDFGPSGSSEDDRARRALRPPWAEGLCACGSALPADANYCRRCGRPKEGVEARETRPRRAPSSGSSQEQPRRRSKRPGHEASGSEEEVTLEPEAVKPVRKKSSRSSSKRVLEVREESGDEKARREEAEKLQAKVKLNELALAEAEAKNAQAMAEAKALVIGKEQAEAQTLAALAEAKALQMVKDEAEARSSAAASELLKLKEAKEDAEASLSLALTEAKAALEAKATAEAQVETAWAEARKARGAQQQAEAEAAGAQAEVQGLAAAKAALEAQRRAAVAEAAAAAEGQRAAEARSLSASSQAEAAMHTRQAAEAKSKASAEALAQAEQRLAAALGACGEAKASAEAWAAEAHEAKAKAKAKEASQQHLVTLCAEARCRCLALVLSQQRRRCLDDGLAALAREARRRRQETVEGLLQQKVQNLEQEHQQVIVAVRAQLEEQLGSLASERRQLLERCGHAVAGKMQMAAALREQRLLAESFRRWRSCRGLRAARLLERLLRRHAQRRHLQIWRQQMHEGAITYLEVQIDCFESFTAKRNCLTWRVLNKCGGYWVAEQQDLTILAVLQAWRAQVQQGQRSESDRSCGCQKLLDVGQRLLRRHLWAPWLRWQQAEQRSLTAAMRQVEECHARKEAELLKMELEQVRLQAAAQRDVFAAEVSQLKQSRVALEELCGSTTSACSSRSWRRVAGQLRAAEIQALLRGMASVLPQRSRQKAALSCWRSLCSALLASQPWQERSGAAWEAVAVQRRKRQQSGELLRQRRPLARLAAFGLALWQRKGHSLAVEMGRCFRAVREGRHRLERLAALASRAAARRAVGAWRGAARDTAAALWRRERWEALLSNWSSSTAVQEAGQMQRSSAATLLLKLLAAVERRCRGFALRRWRQMSWACGVEAHCEQRISLHCEGKRSLRLERGLSIFSGVVNQRLQLSMSQALGQLRVGRWQAKVRSLDDSLAREHRRMLNEFEELRKELLQSRQEAFSLQCLREQEEQQAQSSCHEAQEALHAAKRQMSRQEAELTALAEAKALAEASESKLRQKQQEGETARIRIYQQQVETLQQRVFLGAWRRASQTLQAEQAQRASAAQLMITLLAAKERRLCGDALQSWRGLAATCGVEEAAELRIAGLVEAEKELRLLQGLSMLGTLVQKRQRCALLGHWRLLRWQAAVRSLDASFARDQRRLLAEAENLRAQLEARAEETQQLRVAQQGEQERSLRTRQEAEAILEAVKKERANQVAKIADSETVRQSAQQLAERLQEQLDQALAEVAQLDAEKRSAMQQMCSLHSELHDAQSRSEDLSQAELLRERAHQEQVANLKQHASRREAELLDQAQLTEKALEQKLLEKQRAWDLQSSIAEDQEKNLRHLEDLLKEQGEQLARERNEHQRGLNALRASASLSESKTSLLQEQVVALRQQLQREHRELLASERAWSCDRATLLSASTPALPPSGKKPKRKASPASPKPGARCPWHQRSSKLAPALM